MIASVLYVIVIIGDRFVKSELQTMSSEELQREFDRQARITVQKFGNLLGSNDELEAEYHFIAFCRKYVSDNDNRWQELREYVHGKESAAAPSTPHQRPIFDYIISPIQHPIPAAAPSTSSPHPLIDCITLPIQHAVSAVAAPSTPHLRRPIDYVTSPIQHPRSAAAAPSTSATEEFSPPTLLSTSGDKAHLPK